MMYEYDGIKNKNQKLQHWALMHQPGDDMRWKESWWSNVVFLRDTILGDMFYWPMVCNSDLEFEEQQAKMSENYEIVGTHWSKSIELPVIKMKYKGAEIVFRYNFYDYEITVISDKDLEFPDGLFNKKNRIFYYQGFPDEYKIKTSYAESKKRFSVTIKHPTGYNFYTFMFLLKNELDR